jgi:hypothetical protein
LHHCGPEKRYGSTRDDDADAGSTESSSIVITRGRDEEDGAETGFALRTTDEEADALRLALGFAGATQLCFPLPYRDLKSHQMTERPRRLWMLHRLDTVV